MNRFDAEFFNGARESALAIHDRIKGRRDVPADIHEFVALVLERTGERRNRDFREALGLVE